MHTHRAANMCHQYLNAVNFFSAGHYTRQHVLVLRSLERRLCRNRSKHLNILTSSFAAQHSQCIRKNRLLHCNRSSCSSYCSTSLFFSIRFCFGIKAICVCVCVAARDLFIVHNQFDCTTYTHACIHFTNNKLLSPLIDSKLLVDAVSVTIFPRAIDTFFSFLSSLDSFRLGLVHFSFGLTIYELA